jgi:hypothetical protein
MLDIVKKKKKDGSDKDINGIFSCISSFKMIKMDSKTVYSLYPSNVGIYYFYIC